LDPVLPNLRDFPIGISELGFFIQDGLLSELTRGVLLDEAQSRHAAGGFRPAMVGKGLRKKAVESIRGDEIYWIDHWDQSPYHLVRPTIDAIMLQSRRDLFLPVKRFEGHFVRYPEGAFYKKHYDRHRGNPSRLLSSVIYLGDWMHGDGGELMLYRKGAAPVTIEPKPGRMVVFDSSIQHEVLLTACIRWSLTGWFRDDIDPVVQL